jgi:hypothetical protein
MRLPGWIDRDGREPVAFPGSVVLPDGRAVPVTITDVSEAGCRIECEETLPIAATVGLEVAGRVFEGDVRWSLLGTAGLRMRNPR